MDRPMLWTVWLGAAIFCLAEWHWFYILAATLAVGVNMVAVRRSQEVYVSRLFVNLGLICSTGVLAIEIASGNFTAQQYLGHYIILLQLCKLFQRKTNRNYTQILALSSLLMVAAAMVCNTLWFAGLLVVYVPVLCHTAMVFTIKRGLDAVAGARLASEPEPLAVRRIAWNVIRDWPSRALLRRGALVLAAALLSGVAMFLVAPRTDRPLPRPLTGGGRSGGVSGYAGRVRLGDQTGRVYQSNAVLMHVRVEKAGRPALAAGPEQYLRGDTFNVYQGSEWSKWDGAIVFDTDASRPDLPAHIVQEAREEAIVQKVSMDPSLLPNAFAGFPLIALDVVGGSVAWRADLSAGLSPGPLRHPHVKYAAYSLSYPISPAGRRYIQALREHHVSQLPPVVAAGVDASREVQELAEKWCADLLEQRSRPGAPIERLNMEIVHRIATKLGSEYTYTLDLSGTDPSRDGVEDFLLHTKRGHCEYFASAMTVLCRVLGIHARLAAGFVMEEYDSDGEYYIVRGRDAHAWTEVYTPTTGWTIVDATPPGGRQLHGRVWGASVRRAWNHLQFLWYEKVVGYNADAREKVWLAAVGAVTYLLAFGNLDRALVHLGIVVSLVGLAIEALLIVRWVRQARRARASRPLPPQKVEFAVRLLAILARRGIRQRPDQTLLALARHVSAAFGLPVEMMEEPVALYYRIRWGRRVASPQELRRAAERVRQIDRLLSAGETSGV